MDFSVGTTIADLIHMTLKVILNLPPYPLTEPKLRHDQSPDRTSGDNQNEDEKEFPTDFQQAFSTPKPPGCRAKA